MASKCQTRSMASTRSTVINRHVQTQHQHLLDAIHPLEDRAAFFPHTIVETLSVHIIFALQLLSLTATRGTSSVLSLLAPWRQSFFQRECDAFGRHHRRTCVFFRRGHRSTFPRESCHQEHSIAFPLTLQAPAGPKAMSTSTLATNLGSNFPVDELARPQRC